jgi:hypothetical protein
MPDQFKNINGREVHNMGYNPEIKICRIEYNHFGEKSGKAYYYEGVEQEQFDRLQQSESVAKDAEDMFKNKIFKIN